MQKGVLTMAILGAVQVPHPPLILPEVGHGEEKRIQSTIDAFEAAAKFIADLEPDTVIISSPHSILYSDYFHISPGASAKGTMAQFGHPRRHIGQPAAGTGSRNHGAPVFSRQVLQNL